MFAEKWTSSISEKSIEKTCEYSDNPDKLKAFFGNINLNPKPIEIEYVSTGIRKYFPEDKENRQTILVKITREGKEIEFQYGMSIYDTETIQAVGQDDYYRKWTKYYGKKYSPDESSKQQKIIENDYKKIKENVLYSILCCIHSEFYCPPIFEEFCSEFGYDTDSRKAFDTWQNCLKQSNLLHRIIKETEIESFPS